MPEGPEVRTISTKLNQYLSGQKLIELRIPADSKFANDLPGCELWSPPYTVSQVSCKGKHIIFVLTKNNQTIYLLNHLNMTGNWHWDSKKPYIRLILVFETGIIYFSDKLKRAKVSFVNSNNISTKLSAIGIDYLQLAVELFSLSTKDFETRYWSEFQMWYKSLYSGKRINWQICKVLMEQDVYSGIGNYLKAEILYKCRMRPDRLMSAIQSHEWNPLFYYILSTIYSAFQAGGLSFSDYSDPDGNIGTFDKVVYDKKFCPLGYPISQDTFKDGRTTHWVQAVQK